MYTFQGGEQILSNLIANAIDASREGGKIIIRARACRDFHAGCGGIRITIADNGVGISIGQQKLFAPFSPPRRGGHGPGVSGLPRTCWQALAGTYGFAAAIAIGQAP